MDNEKNANKEEIEKILELNVGRKDNLENYLDAMGEHAPKLSTGIAQLDEFLNGGLREGGINTIAARPTFGKTSLVLMICMFLSNMGRQILYCTNDVNATELVAKGLSYISYLLLGEQGYSMQEIEAISGDRSIRGSEEFQRITTEYKKRAQYLKFIDLEEMMQARTIGDTTIMHQGDDLDYLINFIIQYAKVEINPILVIDYLQVLKVAGNSNSDKERVDTIMRRLKEIAVMGITVILISSINRASYDRPLTLDSLKESGDIEYASNIILGLQFPNIGTSKFSIEEAKKDEVWKMELTILKDKMGRADRTCTIGFYPKFNIFGKYEDLETKNKIFTPPIDINRCKKGNKK